MSIQVSHLTKLYGSQKAVDDISFTAKDNQIVGFLGPNGAGKSTTMKMITGFLEPDSGIVTVNGLNTATDPIAAKKLIGYLPEANPLYYEMYVREYLTFIAGLHNIPSPKSRIAEVIEMTGLALESNKKTGQLSKGYKQRVGLAAALIHDPAVLILDEPTSGLDPNQIVEIRTLIKQLGKNKTVLFSSHILQEVESICDHVIIINLGKIVADNSLENLRNINKTGHVVAVRFVQKPAPEMFLDLPHASGISEQDDFYYIETSDPEGLKKNLLEFSIQNNLDIRSLQSKSNSLEDVFRSLTSGPAISEHYESSFIKK